MIRAILTDIEGTTSSLSFVKDVLFPYAHRRLDDFLRAHAAEPAVVQQLGAVSAMVGRELSLAEAAAQLRQWIDEDRKITPLKALQGMIWEEGYHNGDFTGHVYADAAQRLRAWQAARIRLYVFSSGSVQAQKLLFGYSDHGDLTPLFSGYFDTTSGNKRDPAAYTTIAAAIGLPAQEILFLSDIVEELDAAQAAGMRTCQLVRDGALDDKARHRQELDFNGITL
ncbi:acireductone synthase [Sulfurivermis fontis]|uniref:acireductone synthase n=1 Tax=Sulfurivermis fontis TaxID=1972068 RepID=UPI000FD72AF2|nr:acireductone synthase [Sulfurivermis fontis]